METGIISSKYQIVIPKNVRKKLGLKPGQRVRWSLTGNNQIVVDTRSVVDEYAGSMTGAWGTDSDAYLRELRDEFDRGVDDNASGDRQ